MSDYDTDIIARIERQQEETRKFVAEQHKLMARSHKNDRWLLPLTMLMAVAASITVGILISLPEYLHMFQWTK